jgi:hypothetical protein
LAANTNPAFPNVVNDGVVAISTANTNRDGTGTMGTVLTAGTNGTRIEKVVIEAQGTTTAGMVRLFLHNGTTAFLITEQTIAAVTPSATLKAEHYAITGDPFPLSIPSGWSLRASTHNAEAFNVFGFAANY